MMRHLAPTLLLLAAACTPPADPTPQPLACNGSPKLCDRRFDEVSFAATHNAMSNSDDAWELPNQHHPMLQQLDDGIRAMLFDTHDFEGIPQLCHGLCGLGHKPLVEALQELKGWLDAHPHEVLAFEVEDYITPEETAQAFADSGLLALVHTQETGQPWPTLRQMIEANRRVVVFAERQGGSPAWYLPLFDWSFETPYAAKSKEELGCTMGRGTPGASVFTLNHFLTNPYADPALADEVNHDPFLVERARQCAEALHHIPNIVAVDFYDIGDVVEAVRQLNGL